MRTTDQEFDEQYPHDRRAEFAKAAMEALVPSFFFSPFGPVAFRRDRTVDAGAIADVSVEIADAMIARLAIPPKKPTPSPAVPPPPEPPVIHEAGDAPA